jgi:hypothetical protein
MSERQPLPNHIDRIYIEHNHGHLTLADVTVVPIPFEHTFYGKVHRGFHHELVGTVVSGGETARLFHHTSHTAYPVGTRKKTFIHHEPYQLEDGSWRVSECFCG